jgi:phosphate transport system substrate-binding protein
MSLKLKKLFITVAAATTFAYASIAAATDITGAGATFPYPAYAKWAEAYKVQSGSNMNYQSIGSGGGIKQISAKTVDFGASDKPLTVEELNKAELMQFPTLIGGVVPVVNVLSIQNNKLKLDGKTLADIYLGKITSWDDPAIAALNKGFKLPKENITVVHRSDGSGTSFVFTNYLSKVSPEWKAGPSEGTAVKWPAGTGGKGNEGVASYVQRIRGSIGYVEYAYALQNKMVTVQMKNRSGEYVLANGASFQAAAASADWKNAPGFYEILTDEPGKATWPISGATFILMNKKQDKPEAALATLKFFDWAYTSGDKLASEMDYVTLPGDVKNLIRSAWKAQITDNAGKAIWTK